MATVHVVILLVYSYIIKTIPLPIGHSTLRQLDLLLDLKFPILPRLVHVLRVMCLSFLRRIFRCALSCLSLVIYLCIVELSINCILII